MDTSRVTYVLVFAYLNNIQSVTALYMKATILPKSISFTPPESFTLSCDVAGDPAHVELHWLKNGKRIYENERYKINYQGYHNALNVINTHDSDAGIYGCRAATYAEDPLAQTDTMVVTLSGKEPTQKIEKPLLDMQIGTKLLVNEGASISIPCKASGIPQPELSWLYEGYTIRNTKGKISSNLVIKQDNTLVINKANILTEGSYTCRARNIVGESEQSVFITVLQVPKIKTDINTFEVIAGSPLRIPCVVNMLPAPEITWYHNAVEISIDQIGLDGSLSILSANEHHSGNFKCTAKNAAGTDTKGFTVSVLTPATTQAPAAETTQNPIDVQNTTLPPSRRPVDFSFDTAMEIIIPFAILLILICLACIVRCIANKKQKFFEASGKNSDEGTPLFSSDRLHIPVQITRSANDYINLFNGLKDEIKINVSDLEFEPDTLGEGYFGVVKLAMYRGPNEEPKRVACKMLKKGGVKGFFAEGTTMSKLIHPRVIELVGIGYEAEMNSPIIVTDYMPNGDLLTHLRNDVTPPTLPQRMKFAIQIAEGMSYLHSQKFIHRDLAARNCMLDAMMDIKIADFGLARECNDDNQYPRIYDPRMPFKWTAFEMMTPINPAYALSSDVWSFGVVLWELMSLGAEPYENMGVIEIFEYLKDGNRLEKPNECSDQLYDDIMLTCWTHKAEDRPPFTAILFLLKNFLREMN